MPAKRYIVTLTPEQRDKLSQVVASNKTSIRQRTHARILLAADTSPAGGGRKDADIVRSARTNGATIARVRRRFVEQGLDAALYHKQQQNRKERALDGDGEAHLIALVCGAAPEGHKRWTLHLLKDTLIERGYTNSVSHETVRQRLKKTNSNRG
jgi:hypothetical protein